MDISLLHSLRGGKFSIHSFQADMTVFGPPSFRGPRTPGATFYKKKKIHKMKPTNLQI
jgi:hypothetical protein